MPADAGSSPDPAGRSVTAARPSPARLAAATLRATRPRQWIKNSVVGAALVFARAYVDPRAVALTAGALGVFVLASGSLYLLNDVIDADRDRRHPLKRLRPVASGALPPRLALGLGAGGAAVAVATAGLLAWPLGASVAAYVALQLLYSLVLKHVVLIDVIAIAMGFVLRAAGGALAIGVAISPWLYLCTFLLALFLAFNKRWGELVAVEGAARARPVLQEYTQEFLWAATVITATSVMTAYALYTFTAPNLPANRAMMLTIPVVMYGLLRYLYLVQVRGQGEAPERALFTDRGILAALAVWVAMSVAVLQAV